MIRLLYHEIKNLKNHYLGKINNLRYFFPKAQNLPRKQNTAPDFLAIDINRGTLGVPMYTSL